MKLEIKRSQLRSSKNEQKLALDEAIRVLRAVEVRSPWSAYELVVKTAVLRGRAAPRGDLVLPKDPRQHKDVIAYFVDEGRVQDALAAGADHAGGLDLAQKILNGEITPTKVFATPSILPVVTSRVARFLGPKNLMPSTKKGTVSEDFEGIISASKGLFSWKGDKSGTIRAAIARISFTPQEVIDNIQALMKSVYENSKDPDDSLYQKKAKKTNSVTILSVRLSSRQGPGIELMHV
ncbi:SubName: Full=Related to MRPL1-Mitochondrial ribosomal protein, large subunit {ECO:0000313/EMBL:CCA69001.1} [Serendipita indica DSM 11827]|uniref:Related to MRPL1-Mitochondrial ribosomal protein, large subunit n=1 Tax=Serendipita indica (strain DSM 11827) TaxID=1109443 RepID=G4TCE7_SERID|nr:SubName: Full=Related to MRPL1-Mitochondrial ribosomal protein, large subunit {ECO:0000313/EMBL:CCA69001.1} [Serendipita indica DSM 11827]CCA69001.1 related to MRPL1-Mitochondrial ribosomal protein, large subunit [Serendipita indica DSM 11827]